jgi:hypothetical protein
LWLGLTVNVEVFVPSVGTETDVGLRLALVRDGVPLTLSETVPPNPPEACTVIVLVPVELRETLNEVGVALREMFPVGLTTSVTVVE